MTDHGDGTAGRETHAEPRMSEQIEDWLTIWQSELSAMVLDRELQEGALRLVEAWASQARTVLRAMAPAIDAASRPAGPVSAPGSPPPDAAPDARDPAISALQQRIDELERRLARLETPSRMDT